MKPFFARLGLAAVFAVSAALISPAMAADKPASGPKLSPTVAKPLSEMKTALDANDLATAGAKLLEAQAVASRTPADDYTINQFGGSLAIKQKDFTAAEKYFLAAAAYPDITPAEKTTIYTDIAELATNAKDWPVVIQYAGMLQAMGPLDPALSEPLAVAYYNSGNKAKALEIASAQVAADKAAGKQSDEGLLDIVLGAQADKKDTAGEAATFENLAQTYGGPENWENAIVLAMGGKGMTETQALNLARLQIATGAKIPVDDYAFMAAIALKAGYPGEAEAFLDYGMAQGVVKAGDKAGAQLGTARAKASADKATLASFAAQAKAHKTGDYDAKLAETYYGYGRYAEAEEAAQRAISKGGVKDLAEAQMVLGMSLARENKNTEAAEAFSKVGGNANEQKGAHLWTLYVQRKYGAATAPAAPAPAH
jgi:tetratricopeptide (TPR) repeat protein